MNNEYRIIPPPEMARLMCEGKTLEFEQGGEGYWLKDVGYIYRHPLGEGKEPLKMGWTSPCRIKEEPKREFNLKPFDRVLVRDFSGGRWAVDFFSHQGDDYDFIWRCVGGNWAYIAPYEGNEHHLGTTNDIPGAWGPEDADE